MNSPCFKKRICCRNPFRKDHSASGRIDRKLKSCCLTQTFILWLNLFRNKKKLRQYVQYLLTMILDCFHVYAHHYKPRLVYFFTPFPKTIYVLWPLALCMACIQERLLIKSGLWWSRYGSRKLKDYNGTIIFEIDIMKNSSPINLKFTFFATVKTKITLLFCWTHFKVKPVNQNKTTKKFVEK